MELEQEIKTYERELPGLLAHEGKFVLIKGDCVAGTFDTWEEAVGEGYRRFGPVAFLAHEIRREDEPVDVLSPLE